MLLDITHFYCVTRQVRFNDELIVLRSFFNMVTGPTLWVSTLVTLGLFSKLEKHNIFPVIFIDEDIELMNYWGYILISWIIGMNKWNNIMVFFPEGY